MAVSYTDTQYNTILEESRRSERVIHSRHNTVGKILIVHNATEDWRHRSAPKSDVPFGYIDQSNGYLSAAAAC